MKAVGPAMTAAMLTLLLALVALPAAAQDRMPAWISAGLVSANLADWTATEAGLRTGQLGEANPLMQSVGSRAALKTLGAVSQVYAVHLFWAEGKKKTAILTALVLIGWNGYLAVHNVRLIEGYR